MQPLTRFSRAAAFAAIIAAPALLAPASVPAQLTRATPVANIVSAPPDVRKPARGTARGARSRARTLSAAARRRLVDPNALRVEISILERRLYAIQGGDTLLSAPAAIAEGNSFKYAGRRWTFKTPRGIHTVLRKDTDPIWTPPDWHYAEVASKYSLKLASLPASKPITLQDGTQLLVRDSVVGVILPDSTEFEPLPIDEEIVFDSTLFIPPVGTKNRIFDGELGRFRLDLGDGYLIHGTPDEGSIYTAVTHGCVRVRDEDLEWLFDHVDVGTPVVVR